MLPKMQPAGRVLLLDLDGTIADTLPHIFESYRHAVGPWVTRPPTDAEVEATFGPAERDCIARMVPEANLDEAEARFFDYYERHHDRGVRLVEGMLEAIDHALSLGWRFGIFTGKGRRSARFTLDALGLLGRVEHLVTGDDVSRPKPDPEGVLAASAEFGVPPNRILLAGDSPADVRAGRSAGAKTAAVLWAAFQPERLRDLAPEFICDTVKDLEAAIDHLHRET